MSASDEARPAVPTTAHRTIIPDAIPDGGPKVYPYELTKYAENGYGTWTWGPGLAHEQRLDLMPAGYAAASSPSTAEKLLRFFTITDIHITDVQSPSQAILFGYKGFLSSAYSGVMMYTHHVLDAAMQTVNALHAEEPLDFGISLGDTCNNTQHNELRWYIDVIDGKPIDPDSGVRAADDDAPRAAWLDAYTATGLDPAIPWYQTRGNHDHFWTGFLRVDDYMRASYVSDTILNIGNVFDDPAGPAARGLYMGCLDGRTEHGDIFGMGPVVDFPTPPKALAADPDRRSLTKSEWMAEFFKSPSNPKGHGFNEADVEAGFACYTFEPKSDVPIRVLVLDDTQRDDEPYDNGYGHISLDEERYAWLVRELDRGQADGMLMVIAAHCPIGVETGAAPMAWSLSGFGTQDGLIAKLNTYPNLILWISGHRHCNVITAFPSPDAAHPVLGFWEVETSSLRDFPQQLRTIEIAHKADGTLSIIATDVDVFAEEGSPVAQSRTYGVAAQQIFKNPVPYLPSGAYNAELLMPLTEDMRERLQAQ